VIRLFNITNKDDGNVEILPSHKFQDLVNRTPWRGIGFSGDGEYVYGGAAHKVAHNIYIWDRGAGVLDKILQGPRDSLIGVDWHPTRPMLASVSNTGSVNLWFTPPTESWSAYAPGFEELEENIVYEEREDEFDLEDEEELTRRKQDEEEAFVEIIPPLKARLRQEVPLTLADGSSNIALGDQDDLSEEEDDDCDEDFIIPVRLSLDEQLPELEGED
jgi:COMPASS component SWD1